MHLRDWMSYLGQKNEHYPISDEFTKIYQQSPASTNGYVYYAWQTGKLICKEIAEPNQKWHFFESYIYRLVEDKEISLDDDAEKIYRRLKCPELLLWIAEASNVDNKIVREAVKEAKKIIKENKKFARNNAGNMIRKVITWECIENSMKHELKQEKS